MTYSKGDNLTNQHHCKSHKNVIIMPFPSMNHRDFYPTCAFIKRQGGSSEREFITEQTLVFPLSTILSTSRVNLIGPLLLKYILNNTLNYYSCSLGFNLLVDVHYSPTVSPFWPLLQPVAKCQCPDDYLCLQQCTVDLGRKHSYSVLNS